MPFDNYPDSDDFQAFVVRFSSLVAKVVLEQTNCIADAVAESHFRRDARESVRNRLSATLAKRREMKEITAALIVSISVAAAFAQPRAFAQEDSVSAPADYSVFPPPPQVVEKHKLEVLTPEQIDPSHLLPPPPKDGSKAQMIDLEAWRRVVEDRTPERYAQARWDNDHEDISAFYAVLGPKFDLSKLPVTKKLIAVIDNDQKIAASAAKVYFHQRFPVAAAPVIGDYHIYSCDSDVQKPAARAYRGYPSGHSTMGYTYAIVLAALVPNKAQEILARADDFAFSRIVCGDHYRMDTEASHALGSALGEMFLNSSILKSQIEAAKAELLAAGVAAQ